jgi:hypothetical protein
MRPDVVAPAVTAGRSRAFLVRMHPNVRCDLAHVCQLDGCAQRLNSAKHQRKLAPRDCLVRSQPLAACEVGDSARVFGDALDECFRAKKDVAMIGNYAPPEVTIRSYPDSPICDVVVVVRGQEMVLRCRDYRQAMRWARLERKTYKISQPDASLSANHDLPLFRSDRN